MKTFNPDKWVQAKSETEWHRSQVQGFLYERKNKGLISGKDGNHVVRDCTKRADQIVWESGYDDGSRYDELHEEKMRQIDCYGTALIKDRYLELESEADLPASDRDHEETLKDALIVELTAERDHYKELAEKGLEPHIKSMKFEDGSFDMSVTGPIVEYAACAFVANFKQSGAENFLEFNIYDRDEPFQRYTLTVQRVYGKSPGELLREANEQLGAERNSDETQNTESRC